MLSPARCLPPRPLVHHVRLASSTVPAPRRGRNLTERYRTLERISRANSDRSASQPNTPIPTRRPTTVKTIAGFIVPEEPLAPADDECCMSGCAVCVYDLHEEALVAYKDSVTTLRAALSALHIPETEWPAHIRTGTVKGTPTTTEKSKDAVLGAFEEMERALRERRDERAAVEAESSS